jgi:hypothetical protein
LNRDQTVESEQIGGDVNQEASSNSFPSGFLSDNVTTNAEEHGEEWQTETDQDCPEPVE